MARFEQLMCGISPENPDGGRTHLSFSPGMGISVCEEIVSLCRGWGSEPPGGLARPAVISSPIRSTMPALKGQLYAIVRISTTVPAFFHAVVLTKADYRVFGYNPFAVLKEGSFLDVWSGRERLAAGTIQAPDQNFLFSPPPNPADVGLVDEALKEFLVRGKLTLNLEAGSPQSDRVLGLVIRLMPVGKREKLRFCSFAPAGENAYGLAAAYSKDTPFSSWQRLFMTMLDSGTPEAIGRYVASVRNCLVSGDLSPVEQAATQLNKPAVRMKNRPASPPLEPLSSAAFSLNRDSGPGNRPALSTRSMPSGPAISPAIVTVGPAAVASPTNTSRTFRTEAKGRSRRPLVKQSVSLRQPYNSRNSRPLAVFLTVVAVLAAGWVYLDRSGKGREWGVFDLANWGGVNRSEGKAPSLLEVVNVGKEYVHLRNNIQRTGLLPGTDGEQARNRAQAALQAKAAGPLLMQADLFLDLAREGMQQGHRPDRELARLRALDEQGNVLTEELALLELAHFSLGSGVLWNDLDKLSHSQVKARRDSLASAVSADWAESNREVGTHSYWRTFQSARRNVSGMASLLELFESPTWSTAWETRIKSAADKVSPTASALSRAYRNNAFLLVRLKTAERQTGSLAVAYEPQLDPGSWPAPAVKDVLGELRRKIGLFGSNEMPRLLADVLALYQELGNPPALIERSVKAPQILEELAGHRAASFDPEVFSPYWNRVRYEAVTELAAQGVAPGDMPAGLWSSFSPEQYQGFRTTLAERDRSEAWLALAQTEGESFLGKWARRQAAESRTRQEELFRTHDQAWIMSQELTAALARRSAQGQDWTSVYVDLREELNVILGASPGRLVDDPVRADQHAQAAELQTRLAQPADLAITAVVVRLDPENLPGPADVVVEFSMDRTGQTFRSEPVRMGPSAPEGTGWVGTVNLDWLVQMSPDDGFTTRVLSSGLNTPLLEIVYPSLSERVGPGALVRPRQGQGGSLVFRSDDRWWRRSGVQ